MKVLDLTLPTPAENLAGDEALLDAAEAGESGEVLRFWESAAPFVVVGYANKIATEVNVSACETRGIPILRRCSGGGTVVQGPGCLNYAVILRIDDTCTTHSISAANQFVMERVRRALSQQLSPNSHLPTPISQLLVAGHTDLAINGRKFSGNAQRRRKNFLLFHGTFLLNYDLALISELLPMPSQEPDYRATRSHRDFLTNLDLAADRIKAALAQAWSVTAPLSEVPHDRIQALRPKYESREWNFKF